MKALRPIRVAFLTPLVLAITVAFAIWAVTTVLASFDPEVDVSLSDYSSDVNADITTIFNIPATDYMYERYFAFTPIEFFPRDSEPPPIGAQVGTSDASVALGLLNGPCNATLPVTVNLLWASTDTGDTITFGQQFDDVNPANGIPDGAEHYPDFLTRIIPGVEPVERHFGKISVSGTNVSINIVYLPAGSLGFAADWGRVSVLVLNKIGDPGGGAPTPSPITDWCTPYFSQVVTFGLATDGAEVRRNPQYGGTYTFRWYIESMRDADGDGYENPLDTCPFHPNVDPSPKTPAGDPDGDGIDGACDPSPATICWPGAPGISNDCDDDGYYNRGDNCPIVANANQADADMDDIGDACDPNPSTPDGVPVVVNLQRTVSISGPAPPPVGGIAELPEVGEDDSSGRIYMALVGIAAAALVALTAGAWYARRRWAR
jgi:hypothetical protein